MLRGDGTGRMGAGPMSGRRAGFCGGNPGPGYANPAASPGLGWGFQGGGRGWRDEYGAPAPYGWARAGFGFGCALPTAEQETTVLKARAVWLEGELEAINKRIEEIQKA